MDTISSVWAIGNFEKVGNFYQKITLNLNITEYIRELQSVEEYSFSWDELVTVCHKTDTALTGELSRLVLKKEIINLRKGFYLIIPPRYSKQEQLPVQLFADKLLII